MAHRSRHIIPDYPADRPKVPDVLPLVRALYARKGGGVGCCLHVVLDEGNLGRYVIHSCSIDAFLAKHQDCYEIAKAMFEMTPTQRRKLYGSR